MVLIQHYIAVLYRRSNFALRLLTGDLTLTLGRSQRSNLSQLWVLGTKIKPHLAKEVGFSCYILASCCTLTLFMFFNCSKQTCSDMLLSKIAFRLDFRQIKEALAVTAALVYAEVWEIPPKNFGRRLGWNLGHNISLRLKFTFIFNTATYIT